MIFNESGIPVLDVAQIDFSTIKDAATQSHYRLATTELCRRVNEGAKFAVILYAPLVRRRSVDAKDKNGARVCVDWHIQCPLPLFESAAGIAPLAKDERQKLENLRTNLKLWGDQFAGAFVYDGGSDPQKVAEFQQTFFGALGVPLDDIHPRSD